MRRRLGECGGLAFNVWENVCDQRHASFGGAGALIVSELSVYLERMNLDKETEDTVFGYVRLIDSLYLSEINKKEK